MNIEEIFKNKKLTANGDDAFVNPSSNEMLNILFQTEYYRDHPSKIPSIGVSDRAKLFSQMIRDPRFGLGCRNVGRVLLRDTGCSILEVVRSGRVDDLFHIFPLEEIAPALKSWCEGNNALVKKWMPRYSSKDKKIAEKLSTLLFPEIHDYIKRKQAYGKLIKVETTESLLTAKNATSIKFDQVPSLASIKYAKRFAEGDDTKERYAAYLEEVRSGKKAIHVATSTPYDIYKNRERIDPDVFFSQLEKITIDCLPIVDTSSSMFNGDAFGKALAIGHYLAKCSTTYPDKAIAFSSQPHFIHLGEEPKIVERYGIQDLRGDSQYMKEIRSLFTGDCSNTNFGAVMNLLSHASELPQYLIVLTDGEFDRGANKANAAALAKWKEKGLKTKMVWWNLNSEALTAPEMDDNGNIFMSGYNPMLLKFLEASFDAQQFLDKLLDEYKKAVKA